MRLCVKVFIIAATIFLTCMFHIVIHAQVLPDAPLPNVPASNFHSAVAPAARCGRWQCWDYRTHHISNREVFNSKKFWGFAATDVLASSFDAEMSHHQGRCLEGGEGLSPHPTRWQLYEHNLPENAAAIVVGFVETKLKMPTWLMFTNVGYPLQSHLRAGLKWEQNCW
jgi:hypothetical protein